MSRDAGIDTFKLVANTELHISSLIAEDFSQDNLKVSARYAVERMAYELRLSLRLLGEPPHERVLATYPTTRLDCLKCALGMKHNRTKVMQRETVVYPKIPIPKMAKEARIYVANPIRPEGTQFDWNAYDGE